MTKYIVWSKHVPEVGEPFEVPELQRTDKRVAENDRTIIADILHRKAWLQEVES